MVFWNVFLDSIKLPNQKALFRLNRIGMDIVVIYLFILLLFVSVPSFIQQIAGANDNIYNLNLFFQIIYFFIFYYLPMNVIMFSFLSFTAFIGIGMTKFMNRKLRFAILWKMCAFSITIPLTLYTVIVLFTPIHDLFLWIAIGYTFLLLIKLISIYPRRRSKKIIASNRNT